MRVRLAYKDRIQLFKVLKQRSLSLSQIAELVGVSVRTITDWKSGKYTIPHEHFNKIIKLAGTEKHKPKAYLLDDWWNNKDASRKGASIRMQKHGPLGTPESRRLGGINSYRNRRHSKQSIFTPKPIKKPANSELLAEFVGIMIGDGGMTKYQTTITVHSEDDHDYSLFISGIIKKLFKIKPALRQRREAKCTVIMTSSVELVQYLKKKGVLQGNKIVRGLDVPQWIVKNKKYKATCLRGIFDTDGCIYWESHQIKQKTYCYPRWSLVSASPNLRKSVSDILFSLGFHPKTRSNRSVNLENQIEILKYFEEIGTNNRKHSERFKNPGGVG